MGPDEQNQASTDTDPTSQSYCRQAKLLYIGGYICLAAAASGLIYWLFIL